MHRREFLGLAAGIGAVALVGCHASPAPPLTMTDIDGLVQELSNALNNPNLAALQRLVGNNETWARYHRNLHALEGCAMRVHRGNNDPLITPSPTTANTVAVMATLDHRFPTADAGWLSTPLRLTIDRSNGHAQLTHTEFVTTDLLWPWTRADVIGLQRERANIILPASMSQTDQQDWTNVIDHATRDLYADLPVAPLDARVVVYIERMSDHNQTYRGITTTDITDVMGRSVPVELAGATRKGHRAVVNENIPPNIHRKWVIRHEVTHSLCGQWNTLPPPIYIMEGVAEWAGYGYLAGLEGIPLLPLKELAEEAVAAKFWQSNAFYTYKDGAPYGCALSFFCWLERQLGKPTVWHLTHEAYLTRDDACIGKALGMSTPATWRAWADWVKQHEA